MNKEIISTCGLRLPLVKILILSALFLSGCVQKAEHIEIELPDVEPVVLRPYATFDSEEIDESSGIIKSRVWDDLYWTHNDSGDRARIFPVNRSGELLYAHWDTAKDGIEVGDAVNVDWEDIAVNDDGNLIIGAFGNNYSARRDLALYILKEPYPFYTSVTRITTKIPFYYPEQREFPAKMRNFDAEALIYARGKYYLLTKHRDDTNTVLYRFDSVQPNMMNPVTKIGSFNIHGMVTAADVTPDGNKLVVLTYTGVWLFESETDDYFNGRISWLPIRAKQCEGICFDDENTLLITNEQAELFELSLDDLIVLRE